MILDNDGDKLGHSDNGDKGSMYYMMMKISMMMTFDGTGLCVLYYSGDNREEKLE